MTQSLPIGVPIHTSDCSDWLRHKHMPQAGQSEPSQEFSAGQELSFLLVRAGELEKWQVLGFR